MHVGRLGRQIGAVGGIPRPISCGFIRRRRQDQRRVDDIAEQYTAHFQAGLVRALAPLQQIAARNTARQALAENALLSRRQIGKGQCHGAVGLAVPRLIGRSRGARHDGRIGGPQHRRGIDRATGGEAIGLDRATPVPGVVAGLEIAGAAGDTTAAGAGLGAQQGRIRRREGIGRSGQQQGTHGPAQPPPAL
ncbi:hypothetical protein D3C84_716540 [compost metagenome]